MSEKNITQFIQKEIGEIVRKTAYEENLYIKNITDYMTKMTDGELKAITLYTNFSKKTYANKTKASIIPFLVFFALYKRDDEVLELLQNIRDHLEPKP